ncbi:MAG: serine/threonine protein kinase [Pseudomonadota bacterium]
MRRVQQSKSLESNSIVGFELATVLKSDAFGTVSLGTLTSGDHAGERVVERDISRCPFWTKPIARFLAARERRALSRLPDSDGLPALLACASDRLYRRYMPGVPLHLGKPQGDEGWVRDARAALRTIHRSGIAHNDLAKQQNWLVLSNGSAGIVDFQLASVHRRRSWLFRLLAREDLRHFLKHKRRYLPDRLTASEKRLLARKSLPNRIWMATGKRLYKAITRGVFNWSDSEGNDRVTRFGEALEARFKDHKDVDDAVLVGFPDPKVGLGLYAFIASPSGVSEDALRSWVKGEEAASGRVDRIQIAHALPSPGAFRREVLQLIALNLVDSLPPATSDDPVVQTLVAGRLNLTDRVSPTELDRLSLTGITRPST